MNAEQHGEMADRLLLLAEGELAAEEAATVRAHVASCIECQEELDGLQRSIAGLKQGFARQRAHVDVVQLAETGGTDPHLDVCPECRDELRLLREEMGRNVGTIREEMMPAALRSKLPGTVTVLPQRSWRRPLQALAASILLIFGVGLAFHPDMLVQQKHAVEPAAPPAMTQSAPPVSTGAASPALQLRPRDPFVTPQKLEKTENTANQKTDSFSNTGKMAVATPRAAAPVPSPPPRQVVTAPAAPPAPPPAVRHDLDRKADLTPRDDEAQRNGSEPSDNNLGALGKPTPPVQQQQQSYGTASQAAGAAPPQGAMAPTTTDTVAVGGRAEENQPADADAKDKGAAATHSEVARVNAAPKTQAVAPGGAPAPAVVDSTRRAEAVSPSLAEARAVVARVLPGRSCTVTAGDQSVTVTVSGGVSTEERAALQRALQQALNLPLSAITIR